MTTAASKAPISLGGECGSDCSEDAAILCSDSDGDGAFSYGGVGSNDAFSYGPASSFLVTNVATRDSTSVLI